MVKQMKKTFLLVCIFANINAFSQIEEDFNNDGKIDKLIYSTSFEPDIAYRNWEIKNGKNGKTYSITYYHIDNIIKSYAPLQQGMDMGFLSVITKTSKRIYLKKPDASLSWLINYAYSTPKVYNKYFIIKKVNPPATLNDPKELKPYFIVMQGDSLRHLQSQKKECQKNDSEYIQIGRNIKNGILFYEGGTYFDFPNQNRTVKKYILLDKENNVDCEIYKTLHGVYIKKGNYYTWLYVSDYCLTSSSLRQRHASILDLKIVDRYLFLQTMGGAITGYNIIIDLETKEIAQLGEGISIRFLKKGKINVIKHLDPTVFITLKEIDIENLSSIFCK